MASSHSGSAIQQYPSLEQAVSTIRNALSKGKGILIVGNCRVDYRGRATSRLEPGERIVIFKQDGSVLVHRPFGYEPVNWQPPGCILQADVSKDVLEIRAVRHKPSESVWVSFDKVYLLYVLSLADKGQFALYASEVDMQRALLLKPSMIEAGFKPISYEKKVEPGFVDVYGIDEQGRLIVIEIKRKTAGREAVLQLANYVEAIKAMTNRKVRGILAAPRLGKGVQRLLVSLNLEFKTLDPKKCSEVLKKAETKRLTEFFEGK